MIEESEAIVVGKIVGQTSEFEPDGRVFTWFDIEIEQVLKGDLDGKQPLRIKERGGIIGKRFTIISDNVEYWKGNRALIFLDRDADGLWSTYGMSLGKFDFVTDSKTRRLAVRWATQNDVAAWTPEGKPHEEKYRDAAGFINFIRSHAAEHAQPGPYNRDEEPQKEAPADYFVENVDEATISTPEGFQVRTDSHYPPSAYTHGNFRWEIFDAPTRGAVSFVVSGSQPGYDSTGAAQRGLAAWTNDPGSIVDYRYGGTQTRDFTFDGVSAIVFNHATAVPAGSIAYAQWSGGDTHEYKGEIFASIIEGDVVVKSGISVSQTVFDEAVTHELGHTLGLRHSDQGTPSSTQAVMKASLSGAYGASLGPWDIEAVRHVYEGTTASAPSTPANLSAQAQSTTSIAITWNASTNASGYELQRSTNNSTWTTIATPTGTSFTDTGRSANTTYLYRVRATGTGGTSGFSNIDHATTIFFTDDPIVPQVTWIRAVHIVELRSAVNAVRAAAGLSPAAWTDPSLTGQWIRAIHVNELRSALTQALNAIGKATSYTDTITAGVTTVRAVHVQELRNYVK